MGIRAGNTGCELGWVLEGRRNGPSRAQGPDRPDAPVTKDAGPQAWEAVPHWSHFILIRKEKFQQ